jgi:preprotein translocase subunit SecB
VVNLKRREVVNLDGISTIISNVTAHCPFGKYSLPSIDLTQLVNDKINKNEKKECK